MMALSSTSARHGRKWRKARFCSSRKVWFNPRRWAIGAYTSSVSLAMRAHLSLGVSVSVRILCVRSASLIRITRTSRAMAKSIFRNDSAWFSSRESKCSRSSLVRPSTSSATGEPKRCINSGLVTPQSSKASCSRAAIRACASSFHSAHWPATAIGCVM